MLLRRLQLTDLRSYRHEELTFGPGVTVLVGRNAQGKTNILEAIHRVSLGVSHRVASDRPLVRVGAERAVIRATIETDAGRERTLDVEIAPGARSRVRVDGHDVRRSNEAIGVVRVVLFAPEDLALVRGDPGERRRFLDDLLSLRRPAFAVTRAEYERVVRQRNGLLRQLRGLSGAARRAAAGTVEAWTEQLVQHGAALTAARMDAVEALTGPVDGFYRELSQRDEPVVMAYEPAASEVGRTASNDRTADVRAIADALRSALADRRDEEERRGVTLAGPHRDELALSVAALPARTHASQGEAWSLALALRLATAEVLSEVGDRPVICLDDVFAELDSDRRFRLAEACQRWDQVLVTAAVEADAPTQGRRLDVRLDEGVSSVHGRPEATGGAA